MFTDEQKKELAGKLDPKNVSSRSKGGTSLSYIEGWFTEEEANRIFGFDGWTSSLLEMTENTAPTQNEKGNYVVSFRAKVRIEAGGVFRDGVGFGSGIAKSIHDAYEGAIKEAATDAEKRALKTFGNKFGLALYDKEQSGVGTELTPQQKWLADASKKLKAMNTYEGVMGFTREQSNIDMLKTLSTEQVQWYDTKLKEAQERTMNAPLPKTNGHAAHA